MIYIIFLFWFEDFYPLSLLLECMQFPIKTWVSAFWIAWPRSALGETLCLLAAIASMIFHQPLKGSKITRSRHDISFAFALGTIAYFTVYSFVSVRVQFFKTDTGLPEPG